MSQRDNYERTIRRDVDREEIDIDNDVERFRSQKRQIERNRRHQDQEDHDGNGGPVDKYMRGGRTEEKFHTTADSTNNQILNHGKASSAASSSRPRDFASEREQRMARLRQQLKEEDDDLAALDQGNVDMPDQALPKPQEEIIMVNQEELEGMDDEEQMKRLLGFDGFGSTKGKTVQDNHSSAARGVAAKNKARKYRQYMNRKNGFNRPLEKMN